MNLGDNALSAFQTAAGVAPDKISLLIRTLILVSTFIWAAWCVYGEIHHARNSEIEVDRVINKIMRVLFIIALILALVFIG